MNILFCPNCNHKMKARTDTDEHDTYITVKCLNSKCNYTISPSHDSETIILEYERYNNIPHTWNLKVAKKYFDGIIDGSKTFEFRRNDRDYQIGDFLHLQEFEAPDKYFRSTTRTISYIVDASEVNFWDDIKFEGFIILGFKNMAYESDILLAMVQNFIDFRVKILLAEHFQYDFSEWTVYAEKQGFNYEQQLKNAFQEVF